MTTGTIRRTDSNDADFLALVDRLNAFLADLNGEMDAFYAPNNVIDYLGTVVVAYGDDGPIGIGAYRAVDSSTVEVKRMFVEPDVRGRGTGAAILTELERWAIESGYQRAILETSRRLDSALSLYRRFGYLPIPNYEPYEDAEDSVCFRKDLRA